MSVIPSDPEALLEHAAFVRALAAATLRGDQEVEDLVQDTWVAALDRGGSRIHAPRAWLAGTLRRLAARRLRGRERDRRRLAEAARRRARVEPPSAATVAARAESGRRLIDAVLSLPGAYREVVLLRYYDDLPPRQIAAALDRPVNTVRTQLRRGLALLRERLDERHGGDRTRWTAALVLLAPPEATTSSAVTGGAIVTLQSKTLFVGAILICVCIVAALPATAPSSCGTVPGASAGRTAPAGHGERDAASLVGRPDPPGPDTGKPEVVAAGSWTLVSYPTARPAGRLGGKVVDAERRPAAGAEVVARSTVQPQLHALAIQDDRDVERTVVADAGGAFEFEDLPEGPYVLRARRERYVSEAVYAASSPVEPAPVELRLSSHPDADVLRVTVNDATGRPVEGARVEVVGWLEDGASFGMGDRPPLTRTTDAEGCVAWSGVEVQGALVRARHEEAGEGVARLWCRKEVEKAIQAGGVVVVLEPAGSILGTLRTADGSPPPSLAVTGWIRSQASRYNSAVGLAYTTTAGDGRFVLAGLPAGRYQLGVAAPWRIVQEPVPRARTSRPVTVELEPGGTQRVVLDIVRGGSISGTVVTKDGTPVVGARVRAVLDPGHGNVPDGVRQDGACFWRLDCPQALAPDHPLTHVWATTDARGRYRMDGLEPGLYRVEVFAPRLSLSLLFDVQVADGRTATLEHVLEPAGVLQGVAPGIHLGVRRLGEDRLRASAVIGRSRCFTIAGLPSGEYELLRTFNVGTRPDELLCRATVVAGRTTLLDLRNRGRHAFRGRIRVGGRPLVRAEVRWQEARTLSGEDGEFTLRATLPPPTAGYVALSVRRPLHDTGCQSWQVARWHVGAETDVDVGLVELGARSLEVTTRDETDRAVSASVVLWHQKGPSSMYASARTDADGWLRIDGCPEGPYRLQVTFADGTEVVETLQVPGTVSITVRPRED